MKNKNIAIITARGGSKRIPKKNVKSFCGKPILAYSIEAARNSGIFSEVMVSTDSEEIAELARKYGAEVPFMRSSETSNDYATTADVIMEVMKKYEESGRTFDYICCIYPTAPFVTPEKLKEAMKTMEEHNPLCVMPVVKFSYPPQRSFVLKEDGSMEYKYREYRTARSQDLEGWYHDAGQFYCYNAKEFLERSGVISDGIYPVIVSEMQVQDIDNEEDWKIAELKYKLLKEDGGI